MNELEDASDASDPGRSASLSPSARQSMKVWWPQTREGKRSNILWNYQMLLMFCGKPPLDEGRLPYQDAQPLIELRNTLVHFRPVWVRSDEQAQLETKLKHKFPANSLHPGNPWWIHGCLGSGCARWGFRSAEALVTQVLGGIGVTVDHEILHHR